MINYNIEGSTQHIYFDTPYICLAESSGVYHLLENIRQNPKYDVVYPKHSSLWCMEIAYD